MTVRDDHLEGKYEILEKLGEGGMGAVYKARHRLLDEIRVIKVMRAGLKGDEDLEKRFFQEARVASRLRHPNVAQLFDFTLDDDGTAYIVMEFIDGQTFEEIVEHRGPMEIGLAIELALQSLRAIEYLHRMNFVHRDIAPDNLMLTKDTDGRPLVKLIDLGITKSIAGDSGLTATGMFLGKFKYTSPEQLSASPTQAIDGRADLYSFGVVLYELVSGQSPISGDTPPAMIGGHLFRPPIPFAETDPEGQVPPGLRSLIMEALEKDPQQRIPSAVEFSQRLVGLQAKYPYAGALGTDLVQVPKEARADASQVGESTQRRLDRHFAPELADSPEQPMAGAEVLPQQPTGSFDSTSGATRIPGVVPGSPPAGPSAPSAPAPSTSATTVSGAWPVSAKPPSAVSSPASARGPLPSPETPGAATVVRPSTAPPGVTTSEPAMPEPVVEGSIPKPGDASVVPVPTLSVPASSAPAPSAPAGLAAQRISTPPTPRSPDPIRRSGRRPLWIAVSAAVLVFVALTWLSLRTWVPRDPPVPSVVAESGVLILDAVPWGEVVAIADGAGRPVALPAEAETPLMLDLPAGEYRITISNPELDLTLEVVEQVESSKTRRRFVELGAVDVAGYFARAGWTR